MLPSKRKKRKRIITVCFFAVFISYFGFTLVQQQRELKSLHNQKNDYIYEIERAERELGRLQDIIELGDTDEYIEKVAREQLNMIGEGEIIIKDISDSRR